MTGEHRSSKTHAVCEQELVVDKMRALVFRKKEENKYIPTLEEVKRHDPWCLRRCPTCRMTVERDPNAAINICLCLRHVLRTGVRPAYLVSQGKPLYGVAVTSL